MWFEEFDRLFDQMKLRSYQGVLEQLKDSPFYYGYSLKVGSDGKPEFKEWGNPELSPLKDNKMISTTNVDEITTDDEVKYVVEMAGLEKEDIKVDIIEGVVRISGEREGRKYNEQIPLKHKVENNPKATYKNGILEVTFKKEQPKTTKVDVE